MKHNTSTEKKPVNRPAPGSATPFDEEAWRASHAGEAPRMRVHWEEGRSFLLEDVRDLAHWAADQRSAGGRGEGWGELLDDVETRRRGYFEELMSGHPAAQAVVDWLCPPRSFAAWEGYEGHVMPFDYSAFDGALEADALTRNRRMHALCGNTDLVIWRAGMATEAWPQDWLDALRGTGLLQPRPSVASPAALFDGLVPSPQLDERAASGQFVTTVVVGRLRLLATGQSIKSSRHGAGIAFLRAVRAAGLTLGSSWPVWETVARTEAYAAYHTSVIAVGLCGAPASGDAPTSPPLPNPGPVISSDVDAALLTEMGRLTIAFVEAGLAVPEGAPSATEGWASARAALVAVRGRVLQRAVALEAEAARLMAQAADLRAELGGPRDQDAARHNRDMHAQTGNTFPFKSRRGPSYRVTGQAPMAFLGPNAETPVYYSLVTAPVIDLEVYGPNANVRLGCRMEAETANPAPAFTPAPAYGTVEGIAFFTTAEWATIVPEDYAPIIWEHIRPCLSTSQYGPVYTQQPLVPPAPQPTWTLVAVGTVVLVFNGSLYPTRGAMVQPFCADVTTGYSRMGPDPQNPPAQCVALFFVMAVGDAAMSSSLLYAESYAEKRVGTNFLDVSTRLQGPVEVLPGASFPVHTSGAECVAVCGPPAGNALTPVETMVVGASGPLPVAVSSSVPLTMSVDTVLTVSEEGYSASRALAHNKEMHSQHGNETLDLRGASPAEVADARNAFNGLVSAEFDKWVDPDCGFGPEACDALDFGLDDEAPRRSRRPAKQKQATKKTDQKKESATPAERAKKRSDNQAAIERITKRHMEIVLDAATSAEQASRYFEHVGALRARGSASLKWLQAAHSAVATRLPASVYYVAGRRWVEALGVATVQGWSEVRWNRAVDAMEAASTLEGDGGADAARAAAWNRVMHSTYGNIDIETASRLGGINGPTADNPIIHSPTGWPDFAGVQTQVFRCRVTGPGGAADVDVNFPCGTNLLNHRIVGGGADFERDGNFAFLETAKRGSTPASTYAGGLQTMGSKSVNSTVAAQPSLSIWGVPCELAARLLVPAERCAEEAVFRATAIALQATPDFIRVPTTWGAGDGGPPLGGHTWDAAPDAEPNLHTSGWSILSTNPAHRIGARRWRRFVDNTAMGWVDPTVAPPPPPATVAGGSAACQDARVIFPQHFGAIPAGYTAVLAPQALCDQGYLIAIGALLWMFGPFPGLFLSSGYPDVTNSTCLADHASQSIFITGSQRLAILLPFDLAAGPAATAAARNHLPTIAHGLQITNSNPTLLYTSSASQPYWYPSPALIESALRSSPGAFVSACAWIARCFGTDEAAWDVAAWQHASLTQWEEPDRIVGWGAADARVSHTPTYYAMRAGVRQAGSMVYDMWTAHWALTDLIGESSTAAFNVAILDGVLGTGSPHSMRDVLIKSHALGLGGDWCRASVGLSASCMWDDAAAQNLRSPSDLSKALVAGTARGIQRYMPSVSLANFRPFCGFAGLGCTIYETDVPLVFAPLARLFVTEQVDLWLNPGVIKLLPQGTIWLPKSPAVFETEAGAVNLGGAPARVEAGVRLPPTKDDKPYIAEREPLVYALGSLAPLYGGLRLLSAGAVFPIFPYGGPDGIPLGGGFTVMARSAGVCPRIAVTDTNYVRANNLAFVHPLNQPPLTGPLRPADPAQFSLLDFLAAPGVTAAPAGAASKQ